MKSLLLAAAAVAAPACAFAQASDRTEEEIIVTATRSERRLDDAPASVSLIDAQTIADTPAQTLDQILRRSPSVDLPSADSFQIHPTADSVSMRGLGGIRALVLLDGVPINDPFFGYLQWSRVPLENVERVEIVRGGGAPLWGNYAMGGVINVITRAPDENALIFKGGAGSYGAYRANAFGSLIASENARLSLGAGTNHTDGFMQIGPDERGPINVPTDFTMHNATLRGDLDVAGFEANARIDYFDNQQTLQTRLSHNDQRTWSYAGSVGRPAGAGAELTFTFFGSDSRFETRNTGGFEGVPENEAEFVQNIHYTPVEDLGSSLIWSQAGSSGWLRGYAIGVDFHRIVGKDEADIFDETDAFVRTDVGRGKQRFWGAFAQASIRPVEALEVLASVRYQTFENYDAFDGTPGGFGPAPDSSDESIDPRISLRYEINSNFAFRGAAYTAFRAPNLDNLYRAFSVPFGIFQANPELTPERLQGGELGFDVRGGGLRLMATAYYNTIEDLITSRNLDFSELPPGFFFGSRNINAGEARSQGAEVEADWDIGRGFSAAFAYTFSDSQITENALDPASVGRQIGGVPSNRASLALTYENQRGLRLTPQLRWQEASFSDNAHTLPVDEQTIVDLAVNYPLSDVVETYLHIENLFETHYVADNSGFNPPLRGSPFAMFAGLRIALR